MQEKLDTYEYYPYMIFGKITGKYETLMDYSGKIRDFESKMLGEEGDAKVKDEYFPMYQG